jgi:hypothetical protein
MISITNMHVRVFASSVLWCERTDQLVAASLITGSKQEMDSLLATLATNSKKTLTLNVPDPDYPARHRQITLWNAQKGFIKVAGQMARTNARAQLQHIAHPLSGEIKLDTPEHFYAVAARGEDIQRKVLVRLDRILKVSVMPEWISALIELGMENALVFPLNHAGGSDFSQGYIVKAAQQEWEGIITEGVRTGALVF